MPHAGEVLVKVAAAGVCHSDWHLVTGATKHALPVVPGHEGAGVVTAIGAPGGILLQDVADVFHTELVLPQHFEVANARPSPIWN